MGKSTLCGEVAQGLVDQGHNVGYIGLEEGLQRTALRLMSVKANKPLHISNDIPQEDFRQAFDASVGSGHVFLRDGFGSVDPEAILSDIRFMTMAKLAPPDALYPSPNSQGSGLANNTSARA